MQELTDRLGNADTTLKRQDGGSYTGRIWHLKSSFPEGFASFLPAFICSFLLSLALLSSPLYLVQSDYSALCKL